MCILLHLRPPPEDFIMQTPPTFDFAAMQGSFKLPPPIFIQHKSQDFGMLEIEKIDSSYNKRTGRPIRKSAGRRSIAAGFVNSVEAIELDPNETWFVEQDTTEDADSDNERPKKKARTKRLPSPPLPPLSPMMKEDYPTPDSSPVPEERPEISPPVALPLTLSLNIPPSFQGGVLNINVDLGSLLLQQSNDYRHTDFKRQTASPISDYGCDESCTNLSSQRTGFLDLPGELRNKVYRLAFVTPDTIESNSKGWARSGQFLATCRTVYEEGRSILYGENKFLFERTNKTRGAYYDAVHKEIGYKDVRRFFESIGPSNTALLRDLSFTFDDAMPSMTPYLSSNEERRFTYDLHLIGVLKILGRYSRLRKLTMAFQGRRTLMKIDYRFLDALRTIKADEVRIVGNAKTSGNHYYWNPHPKITPQLKEDLIKDLAREKKLYFARK